MSVSQPSGQILQIEASGRTSSDAVRLANDVAASLVQYVTELAAANSGPAVGITPAPIHAITQEIKALQTQINSVSNRLTSEGAGSNAGQQDATVVSQLRNQQNQVMLQLDSVTSSLAASAGCERLGCGIITGPAEGHGPARFQIRTPHRSGHHWLPHRVCSVVRSSCSSGPNAEVACGSGTRSPGSRVPRSSPRSKHRAAPLLPHGATCSRGRARATDEWALRRFSTAVQNGAAPRSAVRVISFAGDSPALTTGPRLALHAADQRNPHFASRRETSPSSTMGPRSVAGSVHGRRCGRSGSPTHSSARPVTAALRHNCWSQSSCSTGTPSTLAPSDAVNVLSVSPNFLTADELAQLALAATDHGSALKGVVVVNPDPADTTTGRWNDEVVRPSPRSRLGGTAAEDPRVP